MKYKKGFIGIMVVAVIAVLAIGGVYLYFNRSISKNDVPARPEAVGETRELDKSKSTSSTKYVEIEKDGVSFKGDVTVTTTCGDESCFAQKFAVCEPATLEADIGIGAVNYRIIGKTDSGCQLTFKHTKYPDPSWINKDMTCDFDNNLAFEKAAEKVFGGVTTGAVVCTGPLYEILRPG